MSFGFVFSVHDNFFKKMWSAMSNKYVTWYAAQFICCVSVMEKLSMTGSTKITDDPMITGEKVLQQFLQTIRRSH